LFLDTKGPALTKGPISRLWSAAGQLPTYKATVTIASVEIDFLSAKDIISVVNSRTARAGSKRRARRM
jgi:hypothetical protein